MNEDQDALIRALQREILGLRTRMAALEAATGLFESDEMLDRPKGDPKVNFPPRSWRGPDFTGKRFSECSPEFLDAMAEVLTWAADNPREGKERFAVGNRLDAKRARAWARRLRGKVAPTTPEPATGAPTRPAPAPAAKTIEPNETLHAGDEDDFSFPEDDDDRDSDPFGSFNEPEEEALW